MLQYVTNIKSNIPVTDQVFKVIEGGCRWVLIDMDGASDDEVRNVVEAIKPKCIEKEVFLLLKSRVELAKELNVGGVHLAKGDMPSSKARMILGPAAVIGVTANNMTDILAVSNLDIDYYAIGPFAGSDALSEDIKPLGISGIRDICFGMEEKEINIAHVAFGGIKSDDVLSLLEAGVNGVAVSDAIAFSEDIVKETEKFVSILPKTED